MFLLDTNVISELGRPDKANRAVVSWAGAIPAAGFFLSAISIFEIELGALLVARRDAAQGAVLRRWIDDQLLPRFDARILAVDTAVAQRPVPVDGFVELESSATVPRRHLRVPGEHSRTQSL